MSFFLVARPLSPPSLLVAMPLKKIFPIAVMYILGLSATFVNITWVWFGGRDSTSILTHRYSAVKCSLNSMSFYQNCLF